MRLFKTVRGQLTLYFVLIFGVTLCIFSFVLYTIFARQNREEFDKAMVTVAISINDEMQIEGLEQEIIDDELKEAFIPFISQKQKFVEIIDESGSQVFKFRNLDLPLKQEWVEKSLEGNNVFETSEEVIENDIVDSYGMRVLLYPVSYKSKKYVVVIAVSLSNIESALFNFRLILYIAIPSALMFSSLLGWMFSKKAYTPVNELIKNSNSITASNLDTRLPVSDSGDEISKLAATLNNMMERLQRSFAVLKQFTSDASHELRTPLTILKGEIEVALNKKRSADEYEGILKNNLEEVERLQKIVDGLLTLSQMESGKIQLFNERINLDELLIEAVSKIRYLSRGKNINVVLILNETKEDNYDQLYVRGDHGKLLNVFINLLDNAVKYSEANSEIIISEVLNASTNSIQVSIQDKGIGISPDNLVNIFDRFYRADLSRTRDNRNGIGLGLAIVKSVIEAHRGKISIDSDLGKGTNFVITLMRSA